MTISYTEYRYVPVHTFYAPIETNITNLLGKARGKANTAHTSKNTLDIALLGVSRTIESQTCTTNFNTPIKIKSEDFRVGIQKRIFLLTNLVQGPTLFITCAFPNTYSVRIYVCRTT